MWKFSFELKTKHSMPTGGKCLKQADCALSFNMVSITQCYILIYIYEINSLFLSNVMMSSA